MYPLRRLSQGRFLATCIAAALIAFSAASRALAASPTIVLQEGNTSPDGSSYTSLRRPDSAGAGRTAFVGRTELTPGGIFLASSAPGTAVAQRGQLILGAGVSIRRVFRPAANVLGEASWQARVSDFGSGLFSTLASDTIVAARDQTVGAATLEGFDRPAISDNGDVVFYARLSNLSETLFRCTGGDRNCYSGTGALQELVTLGDAYVDSVHAETRVICDLGEQIDASNWGIAFRARTAPLPVGCSGPAVETILRMPFGGAIQTVATGGDLAKPFTGTRAYSRFDGPPEIDNDGDVAVLGETVDPVQEVIYFCDVLACPADPAEAAVVQLQDDGAGRTVTRFKAVGMSDADDIVFQAVASGSDSKALGIYVARAPSWTLERVAANGDAAPGGEYRRVGRPSMTSDGYIAFEGQLKGGTLSRFTLWVYQ